MSSLIERFNAPLPSWIYDIKKEAHQKIRKSRLIMDCRKGSKEAMKVLMVRFWPFVDEFPEIIQCHQLRIFVREFLRHPINALFLVDQVSKVLKAIKNDEIGHKSLWLNTSSVLGLLEDDLYLGDATQNKDWWQVRDIINKVGEPVSIFRNKIPSSIAFLRLSAVEIVAESISHELIVVFNDFGTEAIKWFNVHISHKEGIMSHEELVYRMAFTFDGKTQEKDKINKIIQEVVDLFIEAGETPY